MLNSDFVQWLLKFAFSKSGVAVRWAVGYLVGYIAAKNIVPSGDLDQIQVSLTSGVTAVVALVYAWLQYWLNARNQKGVQIVQHMTGVPISGIVGNNTIKAVADLTGANPHVALASINSNH